MRIRGLTLGLALLSGLSACVSHPGGAMTVGWTFAGGSCSGAAVEQVRIAIAGEPLQQDTFDCRSGIVTFTDFYPGTYNVTVQGLDSAQAVTWTGTQSVRLDRDVSVTVDLQPVSQQNAVYYFSWTFDSATGDPDQIPRCGPGQRLDKVAIFIDLQDFGSYDCEQGLNGNLVITPYVTPGPHQVDLLAFDSRENTTSFAETGPLTINFVTGQGGSQTVPLHWNVGGVQVGWAPYANQSDYNGDIRQSCAAAGITDLALGFHSMQGDQNFSLGSACNASVVLDNVYAGNLTPYIDACGPGGTPGLCGLQGGGTAIYREDPSLVNPPTITVQPGAFFQAVNPTPFQVFIPLFPIP
ncbi:MAG TPA: hypothetical protein VFD38_10970 [Myxococcaceae bacterium]|nr:hypothetical protein [Myxococcaceae bacterium]